MEKRRGRKRKRREWERKKQTKKEMTKRRVKARKRRKENQGEVFLFFCFFLCLWKVRIKAKNFSERILSLTSLILERAYPTNNRLRKFTIPPQKKSIFIKFVTPSAKP